MRVAFVMVVRALPVRLTPRLYTELISAARASIPVAIERHQYYIKFLQLKVLRNDVKNTYLMLAYTGGNDEDERSNGESNTAANVRRLPAIGLGSGSFLAISDNGFDYKRAHDLAVYK